MTDSVVIGPSPDAINVFDALRRRKNVLITGPPGTGKSRLLSEIVKWFEQAPEAGFDSEGDVPFPPEGDLQRLPSPHRTNRQSYRFIFHPGTRYRHLLRELEPVPNDAGSFQYSKGILYQANQHALQPGGTSLLVIDEINRGPAVEIFGDAVVPIEGDKRLDESDNCTDQSFPLMLPNNQGETIEYYFSSHLYVLAAMNLADASVAPLDVAFLRRWAPYQLLPNIAVARDALGLSQGSPSQGPVVELLRAFTDAWQKVNERILLLRGSEYQLGHAVVIPEPGRDLSSAEKATVFVKERWSLFEQHVDELFFGEPRRQVAALAGSAEGTYECREGYVGNELTMRFIRPNPTSLEEWAAMLQKVSCGSE